MSRQDQEHAARRDSAELTDALELNITPKPVDLGAPLVNEEGEVVAIVARACASSDKAGCTLAPYAAPVSAIRAFCAVPRRGRARGLGWKWSRSTRASPAECASPRLPRRPAANAGLRAGAAWAMSWWP